MVIDFDGLEVEVRILEPSRYDRSTGQVDPADFEILTDVDDSPELWRAIRAAERTAQEDFESAHCHYDGGRR